MLEGRNSLQGLYKVLQAGVTAGGDRLLVGRGCQMESETLGHAQPLHGGMKLRTGKDKVALQKL